MTLRVVTGPTVEPLTLEEAKLHLRETQTVQDTLISALIVAARQYAENYTGRAFVTQTLELLLPGFPCDSVIELPKPDLQQVTTVKYIDVDGVLQTIAAAQYQVDIYRRPAVLKPAYQCYWPVPRTSDFNAVQVRYVAGYAPTTSPQDAAAMQAAVPEGIKLWMKIRVAQLFENREAVVVGTIMANIPRDFVDGLLDQYRVNMFR